MVNLSKFGHVLGLALGLAYVVVVLSNISSVLLVREFLIWSTWFLAPILILIWLQSKGRLWSAVLITVSLLGLVSFYEVFYAQDGRVEGIQLLFMPIYQWAIMGAAGLVLLIAKFAHHFARLVTKGRWTQSD